jgi:hypothetical protein
MVVFGIVEMNNCLGIHHPLQKKFYEFINARKEVISTLLNSKDLDVHGLHILDWTELFPSLSEEEYAIDMNQIPYTFLPSERVDRHLTEVVPLDSNIAPLITHLHYNTDLKLYAVALHISWFKVDDTSLKIISCGKKYLRYKLKVKNQNTRLESNPD